MTPQFLRSEAERFRDMAESTDREASRQRLLAMAADYEARAKQVEKFQPAEQMDSAEPELASNGAIASEPAITGSSSRLRLSRKVSTFEGRSVSNAVRPVKLASRLFS